MMRKAILFIFLFMINSSYSQTNPSYKITFWNLNYWITDGVKNNTSSNIDIKVYYEDGSSGQLYYRPIYNSGDNEQGWGITPFISLKKPISISCHVFVNFRTGTDANDTRWRTLTYPCPNFVFYEGYSPNMSPVGFNFKVEPVLNITSASNDLPVEDKIVVNSTIGYLPQDYNWQYSLDLNTWINLSQYNGNNSINIDARDVLGLNAINYHGQNIYIRQVACGQSSKSNVKTFKIRKSAPHILSTITQPTTCSYINDGKVTFIFDRKLDVGENLYASLIDTNTNQPVGLPNNSEIIISDDFKYTITNLEPSNYYFQLGPGAYNNYNTYPLGLTHKSNFTISKPALVDFSLSKVDVWCHGGNDGSITINATGGNLLDATADGARYYYSVNNGNWLPFSAETTHVLSNLLPGTYTIKVRDYKGCNARTPQETDKVLTETIIQPTLPVSLTYTQIVEPTFFGGTNGRLVVVIKGGTRFADNSYLYEWRNSTGILQTNITPFYDAGSASYYLTLNGIPSDTYTLTVKDKNFNSATNQVGCTVFNSTQFLGQPEPIVVTLNITKSISCNVTNPFGNETDFNPTDGQRDESQDGIIQATVTGGVAFTGFENNGLPYKFYWKKQQTNGTWINWNDNDATAENVSHGNYSLNVEDKNGIRLGVYVNNLLSQETPKTQFIQQPDKLELNFQKGDISCSSGNNGWVKAIPTGGTAPYLYEWTTGDTSEQINNLIANNYFVKVTDGKGCIVQGSITVQQPNGVDITETITNPTCDNGNDGSVVINITGGTQPFTYSWSSGQSTRDISNLTAGNYRFTLVDAQGCTYFKDIVLTNPAPILVDLGNDRTLCNSQSLDLDISINDALAQYVWTSDNGFTSSSPTVSLTNSGTYNAKIISSKGCVAQDDIIIKTSNVNISSEFFLSSQAYLNEEVVLVNASNPLGQNTVWQIPNNVIIVSQTENYIILKFPTIGSYSISLKQTQGDCYALYSKIINVEPKTINSNIGNTSNPFISEFSVTPNPSNGNFNALVKLEESSPIKLRLYALNGQLPLIEKSETGQKNYVVNFNINLAAGTYALILETAKQTLVKKIIIY